MNRNPLENAILGNLGSKKPHLFKSDDQKKLDNLQKKVDNARGGIGVWAFLNVVAIITLALSKLDFASLITEFIIASVVDIAIGGGLVANYKYNKNELQKTQETQASQLSTNSNQSSREADSQKAFELSCAPGPVVASGPVVDTSYFNSDPKNPGSVVSKAMVKEVDKENQGNILSGNC